MLLAARTMKAPHAYATLPWFRAATISAAWLAVPIGLISFVCIGGLQLQIGVASVYLEQTPASVYTILPPHCCQGHR